MTMLLVPVDTLDVLRQLNEDNLPHVATIQTATNVRTPGGITTLTWATAAIVDCRLSPITADERANADTLTADATWYVVLPAGTVVTEKQRIIVTGTNHVHPLDVPWTETLLVVGVPAPRANEAMRKVLCKDA